jgi:hypothetical protein
MINLTHPGFGSALDPGLQLACAERILFTMGVRNVFLDGGVRWQTPQGGVLNVAGKLTPATVPAGFQVMELGQT